MKFRRDVDRELIHLRQNKLRSSVKRDRSTSSKKSVTFDDDFTSHHSDRLKYSQLLKEDHGRNFDVNHVFESIEKNNLILEGRDDFNFDQ